VAQDFSSERSLRRLLDYPREDMGTEIKDWLDLSSKPIRAKFSKELIALANHGGGYVLFGFSEEPTGWKPSGPCPYDLKHYSQDDINDIVRRHAEPPFECYVHHMASSVGNQHVVIEIPGGHIAPIRSQRSPQGSGLIDHTYYIRVPGPESAPPRSGHDWEALIRRCMDNDHERQLNALRRLIATFQSSPETARLVAAAAESTDLLRQWTDQSFQRLRSLDPEQDRYLFGWWSCSYILSPVNAPPSLPMLRRILIEVKGTETGWPVWLSLDGSPGMGATIAGDSIECWLRDVHDSTDFWRASPQGRMFLLRRHQEDSDSDFPSVVPGEFLDLILPVWRTGECLLHASRLGHRLEADTVEVEMIWHGIAGRELRALAGAGRRSVMPGRICNDPEVRSRITVPLAQISDSLPEFVKELVSPLYARFDFFEPPDELYATELRRMRSGAG
jgi:hypothetical protein